MLNLYTEIAFQAASPTPSSTIEYTIPRKNGSYDRSKFSSRTAPTQFKSEQQYSNYYLASRSDIYHRSHKTATPKCVLWRLTGNNRILELQSADLNRQESDVKEAYLHLRFSFQDAILPTAIAVTDTTIEDELHIFVCTINNDKNELFHLRIPPAAFQSRDALNNDVASWCTALDIFSLTMDTVFRLYAHNPFEIFLSYTSGKIQRLQRKSDSSAWTPETYDDRTWGASIRGYIGRGPSKTIEYGSSSVDTRALQGVQVSPDSNYLYTTCLNHQLRVWHLPTGKLAIEKDLLDQRREPHDRIQLSPADNGHLEFHKWSHMRNALLVTYSPHDGGQFKFWDVKGGLTEPLAVEDKFPEIKLTPPDPDPSGNTVWSMLNFKLIADDQNAPAVMWVLWRNNNHHQLYSLHFEFDDIERDWQSNWIACDTTSSQKTLPPELVKSAAEDATTLWLNYLLAPGRYPVEVLETALSIYSAALTTTNKSVSKSAGLEAHLCSVVAANTTLRKYDDGSMDFERFAVDTDYQWRNFWRIVENVNNGRSAPLNFVCHAEKSTPYVLMADKCALIRECNELELVSYNSPQALDRLEDVASTRWSHRKISTAQQGAQFEDVGILVNAAKNFRSDLSSDLIKALETAIEDEILTTPETLLPAQLVDIYDNVNLGQGVQDNTFHQLENDVKDIGDLAAIRGDLFLAVAELLPRPNKREPGSLQRTLFGLQMVAAGTLDYMLSTQQTIWDLLVLCIFLEGEFNQEEEKMPHFDGADVFAALSPAIKTLDRNIWLAMQTRQVSLNFQPVNMASTSKRNALAIASGENRTVSILEDRLSRAIKPRGEDDQQRPNTYLIMENLHEIQHWISSETDMGYDEATVFIQCDLINHHELDLATRFLRFQPSTSWSAYIKGRLYLARQEYDLADDYFRQASYNMSCGKAIGKLLSLSAGLLSAADVNAFNNGLPLYLQHVLTLFESAGAYTQVALFARLAVQSIPPVATINGIEAKKASRILRTDILSRLFTAELKTARYPAAFEALVQVQDGPLRRGCTIALINAILEQSSSSTTTSVYDAVKNNLLAVPWTLHPELAGYLDEYIGVSAAAQRGLPSTSSSTGAGLATSKIAGLSNGTERRSKLFPTSTATALGPAPGPTTVAPKSPRPNAKIDYLLLQSHILATRNPPDYRGATAALYKRVDILKRATRGRGSRPRGASASASWRSGDPSEQELRRALLSVINLLTLAERSEAYILVEVKENGDVEDGEGRDPPDEPRWKKRKVIVTLEDVRREYQGVLDRCARIERGDFEIGGEEDEEEDDDDDEEDEDMEDGDDGDHYGENGRGAAVIPRQRESHSEMDVDGDSGGGRMNLRLSSDRSGDSLFT